MYQNKPLFSSPFRLIKPSYPNHACLMGKGYFHSVGPRPFSLHTGGQNQSLKIHWMQKHRASHKIAGVAHCAPGLVFNLLWEVGMWDGSVTASTNLMQSVVGRAPLLQEPAAQADCCSWMWLQAYKALRLHSSKFRHIRARVIKQGPVPGWDVLVTGGMCLCQAVSSISRLQPRLRLSFSNLPFGDWRADLYETLTTGAALSWAPKQSQGIILISF